MPDPSAAAVARPAAQRAGPRLLAGAVAVAASAVAVTAAALLVRNASSALVAWDRSVIRATTDAARANEALRLAAEVGGYVLHPMTFRAAVVVVAVLLWRRRARYAAVWAVSTLLTGAVLAWALKLVVQRARPQVDSPVSLAHGYSFPSGHAVNAALGVTLLLVLLWRPLGRRDRRTAAVLAGLLLVLLVDLDRMLLGVHFPTDVVAGNLVGALVVACSWVAFGPVLRERTRRETDAATDDLPTDAGAPDPRDPTPRD